MDKKKTDVYRKRRIITDIGVTSEAELVAKKLTIRGHNHPEYEPCTKYCPKNKDYRGVSRPLSQVINDEIEKERLKRLTQLFQVWFCKSCNHRFWIRGKDNSNPDKSEINACPFCLSKPLMTIFEANIEMLFSKMPEKELVVQNE